MNFKRFLSILMVFTMLLCAVPCMSVSAAEVDAGTSVGGYAYSTPKISSVAYNMDDSITLKWNGVGAPYYKVFEKISGSWHTVQNVGGSYFANKTSFTLYPNNGSHVYTVRAFSRKEGNAYASSYDSKGKRVYFSQSPNSIKAAYNSSKGCINISWKGYNSAAGHRYRVFYKSATKSGDTWHKLTDVANRQSFQDTNVKPGQYWIYTVRAINGKGSFVGGYNNSGAWCSISSNAKINSDYFVSSVNNYIGKTASQVGGVGGGSSNWCTLFVKKMIRNMYPSSRADSILSNIGYNDGCVWWAKNAVAKNIYKTSSSYMPKAGDIALINTYEDTSGNATYRYEGHVGIVTSVSSDGRKVTVTCGNHGGGSPSFTRVGVGTYNRKPVTSGSNRFGTIAGYISMSAYVCQ